MEFFVSGELDIEIAELFRPIRQEVTTRLNDNLYENNYGAVIDKIALIPIVLSPRFLNQRTERRLVQWKTRTADYRLIIDYESFIKGTNEDRKRLLVTNLLVAVNDISRKSKEFEGSKLQQDILNVFEEIECS